MANEDDITRILNELSQGNQSGSEELLPLVYDRLRRLAASKMRREAIDHTLQPTALVHEAYLRLVSPAARESWDSRAHFFAAAAEAMRRILIEEARRRQSLKRGGEMHQHQFDENLAGRQSTIDYAEVLAVDEALEKLAALDPEAARLVKLRYFAGLSVEEAAEALQVSARTVKRNWAYARAWLERELGEGNSRLS